MEKLLFEPDWKHIFVQYKKGTVVAKKIHNPDFLLQEF